MVAAISVEGAGHGSEPIASHGGWTLAQRAAYAWQKYVDFKRDPGQRCSDCWLLQRFCGCADFPQVVLQMRVLVLMHPAEVGRLRASNTAKLLLRFGAKLLVWGHEEHDAQLRSALLQAEIHETAALQVSGLPQLDPSVGSVWVLFPSAAARSVASLANELRRHRAVEEHQVGFAALPQCVVVLDGGWKETRKMNASISDHVVRCIVASASREEYGGTRKYKEGPDDRVQTAAAFITLLKEAGETQEQVDKMKNCLALFTEAYERDACEPSQQ